ncbi:RNase A-like domain-containing protein [Streptomyces sp. NRRL S-1824]|uniref:RNase A-like domain-containing protein n=1 Tax=Streptomyces sp. NRRL S-1824 TaxID=1463889 RepID=UPI00068CECD0|nr:RNase A-like domain-containing protein [Streptomyces sp. NRRL S-1824]
MAGPSSPTQSPGGNGTIDVKPSDLWSVSGRVAVQQEYLLRGANKLLGELGKYPDAGGAGTEARKFAQSYMKIGNRWLEVWGRSVLSVGGVAVGFTETANAYTRADAAAHPKPGKTAEQRPRPAVIDKAPNFDSIPDIKWGDDDGGDDILRGLMEGIPEVVRDVLQPLCKNVFRVGRVADVHPFPQQHYLNSLCHSWMNVSVDASMGADQLTQAVGAITNHQQSDWEAAMRTFCSALWGGTAWGQQRHGYQWGQTANSGPGTPRVPTGSEPVLAVLKDTADNIATILREYAEAAVDLNRDVADELHRSMWKAAKEIIEDLAKPKDPKSILGTVTSVIGKGAGLILSFDVKTVLNIDTSKLNGIVDKYTGILGGLTARMEALKDPLDEAYLSAPKFEAGVARAHGFGTRALEEFKDSQVWLKIDSTGKYDLNLAANEYMGDGHTLEKHVGKTDEQLAQRLRDQQSNDPTAAWPHGKPGLSGSSAFPNYQRAEELTERNLNKNKVAIEAWIKGPPPASDGDVKSFYDTAPNGETSGRSVSKQPVDPSDPLSGYKQGGLNAKAYDVHGIDTRIRYDISRTPPFTVMTSMPSKP